MNIFKNENFKFQQSGLMQLTFFLLIFSVYVKNFRWKIRMRGTYSIRLLWFLTLFIPAMCKGNSGHLVENWFVACFHSSPAPLARTRVTTRESCKNAAAVATRRCYAEIKLVQAGKHRWLNLPTAATTVCTLVNRWGSECHALSEGCRSFREKKEKKEKSCK